MSVFDDHTSSGALTSFEDKQVLAMFKISNSGVSLIPRKEYEEAYPRLRSGIPKLPAGVFHREDSLGKIIFGSQPYDNDRFIDVVRGFGLEVMIYRGRRFYVINREQKRQIRKVIEG